MDIEQKKKLGAFYTPKEVTDVLSTWAIRAAEDKILEPSFGGCNFLRSSVERLEQLQSVNPLNNVLGFDIDPNAFNSLEAYNLTGGHFFLKDFLVSDQVMPEFPVNVILGNPPYLPIHKLENEYKKLIYKTYKKSDFRIPKRSSLWVYFIIQSLRYLQVGGRMAWIVPDSISFSNYGQKFIEFIGSRFTSCKLVRIQERFFNDAGTQEKTSILISEGYLQGSCSKEIFHCRTLLEALQCVEGSTNYIVPTQTDTKPALPQCKANFIYKTLGDVFDIKIGIVLGATKLLTFESNKVEGNPFYPEYLYPVITKGRQLKRLVISPEILLEEANTPNMLLDAVKLENKAPEIFQDFLLNFPKDILINETFRNRRVLFGYDDYQHPDAFLTFYSQKTPRLILNDGKRLNSTNSVHRMYLKPDYKKRMWLAQFISLQLFSGLLHEVTLAKARQYGNNIKKYEPSDAKAIPVIIPETDNPELIIATDLIFKRVDHLLASGQITEAKETANGFLASHIFESEWQLHVA